MFSLLRRADRRGTATAQVVRHPGNGYRSLLVAYASALDEPALEESIGEAVSARARLTILVPISRTPSCVGADSFDLAAFRIELEHSSLMTARRAVASVPAGVPVTWRCVPRSGERLVGIALGRGEYDLCLIAGGAPDPGAFWGSMGVRISRHARAGGVEVRVVPGRGR